MRTRFAGAGPGNNASEPVGSFKFTNSLLVPAEPIGQRGRFYFHCTMLPTHAAPHPLPNAVAAIRVSVHCGSRAARIIRLSPCCNGKVTGTVRDARNNQPLATPLLPRQRQLLLHCRCPGQL
jgi:hypothetical protein